MKLLTYISKITIAAAIAFLTASCAPKDRYVTITGFAQGGNYGVKYNTKGVVAKPEEVKAAIDSILSEIDNSVSGYNRNSLLSRFNAGEDIVPDSIFIDLFNQGYRIYNETGGIVDAASGPLFDLWGFGFRSGEMPSDETVERVKLGCGMKRLFPDMKAAINADGKINGIGMLLCEKGRFTGVPPLPQLNYNAIAQGYSCDLVARYLYSIGVRDLMVDIGEIFCDGVNPSGKPWTLGIDKPVDGNNELGAQIQGKFSAPAGPCGIVTSGNYRKFYIRDGKKYAHTINPLTGRPVDHSLLSATIVAPDALTADAYATYCMVIGLEASKEFLSSRKDLEGCLIYDHDGAYKTWCSEGFVLEEI